MTPKQRAALERLRQMRADSNSHDGGYPITEDGRFQSLIDHCSAAQIALEDYPADDDCEMTRQELIRSIKLHEEVFRDIRNYIGARVEALPELIAETLDNLTWLVSETDWETLDAKYYQALREITKLKVKNVDPNPHN